MFRKKAKEEAEWADAICPVCKTDFGWRDSKKIHIEDCSDCRADIKWIPGEAKPIMTLHKKKPEKCGCATCRPKGR